MRLLIGFYFTIAAIYLAFSTASGIVGLHSITTNKQGIEASEAVFISLISALMGYGYSLVAWGVWRRWRFVRLSLLVVSWSTIALCVLAIILALAGRTDYFKPTLTGQTPEPWFVIVLATLVASFAAFQVWVLQQPAVRQSFLRRDAAETPGA